MEGDLPVHWETVAELIRSADFTLNVADIDHVGDAFGITDWRNRTVAVREGLPGAQRFKTAVHELAHIRLHEPASGNRPVCRGIIEVEAESVAYMVCAALGIDSAGYSLPYVATWSDGDLRKVSETADRVIRCARQVITELGADRRLERDTSVVQTTSRERPTGRRVDIAGTPARTSSDELYEALHAAISYYRGELSRDRQAQAFLTERGFTQESADRWQVGYAPDSWDSLVNALQSQGLSDEVLLEAGLAGRARTGRVYNRMRGRIIFPVHDAHGSPRGLAGRLINGDGPKYLNIPETVLYKKSELLYGLHHAATPIADHGEAVVVEVYTDVIAAHQAGIINTVATGGTALTDRQLEHLKDTTCRITLAFDGDEAGQQAAERVAEFPAETLRGLNLQVACLPDGTDPAGLICSGQTDKFRAVLGNNKPLVHYLIDRTLGRYDLSEVEAPVRALYAATPLINRLTTPSDRSEVIVYLAMQLNQPNENIERSLDEYARVRTRQRARRMRDLTRAFP